MDVLLLNGPNQNLYGMRNPAVYGHTTLPTIEPTMVLALRTTEPGSRVDNTHGYASKSGTWSLREGGEIVSSGPGRVIGTERTGGRPSDGICE